MLGEEKACFSGWEQTETEVGGGFAEAGWGGSSARSLKKIFPESHH
jgi:hypothetical protein